MRLSSVYGISALLHVAALGVASFFLPSDIGPVLLPISGGGGGLGIEFLPPGIPGGGSESTVHLELPPAESALATGADANEANQPLTNEVETQETTVETTVAVARTPVSPQLPAETAPPQSFEGPIALNVALEGQPQRVTPSVLSVPATTNPVSAGSPGRTVARYAPIAGISALPADAAAGSSGGSGRGGGMGAGIGSARGSGTGGGGGSPGGLVDSYPQKGPSNLPPVYPLDALLAGVEGRVVLRVRVTSEGQVEDLAVERSANWPSLDEAALTAVKRWRFLPARRGGVAIAFEVLVPVRFSIRNP